MGNFELTFRLFGSNPEGRHGRGAALEAVKRHGAVYGQARGIQGRSYAIVTKELRRDFPAVSLTNIRFEVEQFVRYAAMRPDDTFYVTPIGCGLAGFTPAQIAPMFHGASRNVVLPKEFKTA